MDCPLKYIGQTDQIFYTKYKDHTQAIKITMVVWGVKIVY